MLVVYDLEVSILFGPEKSYQENENIHKEF